MTTLRLFRHALRQRCASENEWILRPVERWFYAFKFMVCYFIGTGDFGEWGDSVCVATTGHKSWFSGEFGTMHGWDEWRVGHGVFSNWWWYQTTDGTP